MNELKDLEKLEGLTLDEKPPQLTVEGIRSFLQHSLEFAKRTPRLLLEFAKSYPKIFLKSLLVSKIFLNTARHYPVYTLVVQPGENHNFDISFEKEIGSLDFKGIRGFDQSLHSHSYDITLKLAKLINPKHLYVKLEYSEKSNELLGQCETFFGLVRNGKIGLSLSEWERAYISKCPGFKLPGLNNALVLNRLAPYLNILRCDFDTLKGADVVSTLDLDYLTICSTPDKEEFKALLHYKIQKAAMSGIQFDNIRAITDSEEVQVNSMLQKLEIDEFIGSYGSLRGFLDLLKRHCQKLLSLHVSFNFRDAVLCSEGSLVKMNEILKNLPKIHEKLKALQDHGMSISNVVIRANSKFCIPKGSTLDRDWPKKLKDHEGFKNIVDSKGIFRGMNVAFKSEYGFFTLVHNVEIDREVEREYYRDEYYYDPRDYDSDF